MLQKTQKALGSPSERNYPLTLSASEVQGNVYSLFPRQADVKYGCSTPVPSTQNPAQGTNNKII